MPNGPSLENHDVEVERLFEEEARLGWMIEMTDGEAKERYGENLFVAALGVVEEPGKIRVVHDGSNAVHVNHRIRPKDQTRSPGAGELRRLLREKSSGQAKLFSLAGDVSKAHRRIKVRPQDWGFQACRVKPGKVWVNCVGTYGMASAAYYWPRFAAGAVVRLIHYLLGDGCGLEVLLYVDDFLFLMHSQREVESAGLAIYFLLVIGIPFRWKKVKGGVSLEWIGYWMNVRDYQLGVSEKRAAWLTAWLDGRIKEGVVDMADLRAVMGRLCFATSPLEFVRPFLAPAMPGRPLWPMTGRWNYHGQYVSS